MTTMPLPGARPVTQMFAIDGSFRKARQGGAGVTAMLEEFGPEIWIASGPQVTAALGFNYPTRMAVIRLADRELFVWSPVALSDELKTELAALGTVRHLVAPNSLHDLFIASWKQAYPEARLYAAPGLQQKRKDLAFDAKIVDEAILPWTSEIAHIVMTGNVITTEVVFFHMKSGTVLFTDLLQQFPPRWFGGWRAHREMGPDARPGTVGATEVPPRLHRQEGSTGRGRATAVMAGREGADGARNTGQDRWPGIPEAGVSLADPLSNCG